MKNRKPEGYWDQLTQRNAPTVANKDNIILWKGQIQKLPINYFLGLLKKE